LELNGASPVGSGVNDQKPILDKFTSATPRIVHGRAHGFEIGLFNGDPLNANTVLDTLAGFSAITLEIKTATGNVIDTGAAVFSKTVAAADFNTGLKRTEWDADTPNEGSPSTYHLVVTALDTEIAALDMSSGATDNEKVFGLVITGLNTTYGRVSLARGLIKVVKDGATGAGSGTAPLATYTLQDAEILGLINGCIKAGENRDGASYALFDKGGSGWGILTYVEMEGGRPVERKVIVQRA